MRGRGIRNPFWYSARRKADINTRFSAMSVERSQQYQEDTKSTSTSQREHERKSNVEAESTKSFHQPSQSGVRGNEPKRQKLHDTSATEEPSSSRAPDQPLFQSAEAVGRRWHYIGKNARRHRHRSVPFKIMTYNVLADSLLRFHPMLYENCEEWVLQWEYRKKNLVKEILHHDADILCLQEVEEKHYNDWFQPELSKAGYKALYKKRTGDKVDGCAVFYKDSKFCLLADRYVNFRMDHVAIMDRDNVAILALLYPRYNNGSTCNTTALCIVNTHLLYNTKRGDIKLLQLGSLFAEIEKLKKEFIDDRSSKKPSTGIHNIPVLLCGDFNMTPFCPLYHYISKGFLNYKHCSKKELSGQFAHKDGYYRDRDAIKSNIIPKEMGLTNMSTWHNEEALATNPTSSQACNVYAEDDYSTSHSTGWHQYSASSTTGTTQATHPHQPYHPSNHTIPATIPSQQLYHPSNHTEPATQDDPSDLPKPKQFDPVSTVIRHKLYFWSVYQHFLQNREREATTYHDKEPACTVDFIFAGRDVMCSTCKERHGVMELTACLDLLSENQIRDLGGLPSPILSSDHLALLASFALHL